MYSDNDIKIASDKPSKDIKKRAEFDLKDNSVYDKKALKKARNWGKMVAERFIEDANDSASGGEVEYYEMLIQRRLLLSFTATVAFENLSSNDTLSGVAQKSFIDTLKAASDELYKTSSDTGAFSFYYLAFRRGSEIDRRIGQTFAMLCSHDGDPIYQELGEALYCWFSSVVKKAAEECGVIS